MYFGRSRLQVTVLFKESQRSTACFHSATGPRVENKCRFVTFCVLHSRGPVVWLVYRHFSRFCPAPVFVNLAGGLGIYCICIVHFGLMVGVSALQVLFYIKCQSDFKVTAVFETTLRESWILNMTFKLSMMNNSLCQDWPVLACLSQTWPIASVRTIIIHTAFI